MNILIGVTGGIAAYKAALLIRLFKKEGHQVRVVMTRAAKDFITPLTLATLSGNPIVVENFSPEDGAWNSHISLGEWADVMVIAPATANTLAKMTHGIADNLLLCTYLSARCPVWIAPAMDLDMYAHPATQQNLQTLTDRGVHIVEPGVGFLASGLEGKGRMAEPEDIFADVVGSNKASASKLAGKRVLLTAGATVENIDPVRFISNYSTGRMGIELANVLAARGAVVTLIKGATTITPKSDIEVVDAVSADAMYQAVNERFAQCDIAIFAAAVSDYTPQNPADQKIKKVGANPGDTITLTLRQTNDIAASMGARKRPDQLTVGFALETSNGLENAAAKLIKKNLNAIVLNTLEDRGAGFATPTNKITILDRTNSPLKYELKDKSLVASDIADYLETVL